MEPNETQLSSLLAAAKTVRRDYETSHTVSIIKIVIKEWEAIRPQQAPPAPLTFGDPPQGWTWRNPEDLTPEQVEVDKGWRLYLDGEPKNDSCFVCVSGMWLHGGLTESSWTYRTKAPLPAPKPTPEELDRLEFETWAGREVISADFTKSTTNPGCYLYGEMTRLWKAWQAARNNFRAAQ